MAYAVEEALRDLPCDRSSQTAEDLFICVASRTGPEQLMLSVTSSMAEQVNMLRTLHTSMCVAHRVFR